MKNTIGPMQTDYQSRTEKESDTWSLDDVCTDKSDLFQKSYSSLPYCVNPKTRRNVPDFLTRPRKLKDLMIQMIGGCIITSLIAFYACAFTGYLKEETIKEGHTVEQIVRDDWYEEKDGWIVLRGKVHETDDDASQIVESLSSNTLSPRTSK